MGGARRHARRDRSLIPTVLIRPARVDEVWRLPAIERSAAALFRGSSQAAVADGGVSPAEFHRPLAAQGLVWLAEEGPQAIGFASCELFVDALHIWELAVRREAQGLGAGGALVMAAIEDARRRGARGHPHHLPRDSLECAVLCAPRLRRSSRVGVQWQAGLDPDAGGEGGAGGFRPLRHAARPRRRALKALRLRP